MDSVSVTALIEEWDVLDKEFYELEVNILNSSNSTSGKIVFK